MKNPTAIFTSDWHLRENNPICRTDNFIEAQTRKLHFISDLQKKHNCPIILGGDLFDHWKPSPWLLGYCFRNLPDNIYAIAGNHDLPAHSMENIERSGINVLADAGKIKLLHSDDAYSLGKFSAVGFPWGTEMCGVKRSRTPFVAVVHHLVFKGKEPFPGASVSGGTAKSIIEKLHGFGAICVGDNHQTFVERVGSQVLVNAGSLLRTTAAQADHKPCVFLWCADTNEVEQVFLPIEQGVVSREHIEVKKQRDDRIECFVSNLKKDVDVGLSFGDNISKRIAADNVSKPVQKLIYNAMGR